MISISALWTPDERLAVIDKKATLALDRIHRGEPIDLLIKEIRLLKVATPEFLEANRTQLLDGL